MQTYCKKRFVTDLTPFLESLKLLMCLLDHVELAKHLW